MFLKYFELSMSPIVSVEYFVRTGYRYSQLFPRLVKTLLTSLCDPQLDIGTHYGALVGLFAFGQNVVRTTLIPCLPLYLNFLKDLPISESQRCYNFLLENYGSFLKREIETVGYVPVVEMNIPSYLNGSEFDVSNVHNYLKDYFGSQLDPFLS